MFVILDVTVPTDQQFPSLSAHQVTLSVASLKPLTLQVSWPFLVESIAVSTYKNKKKKKCIRLILKKSFGSIICFSTLRRAKTRLVFLYIGWQFYRTCFNVYTIDILKVKENHQSESLLATTRTKFEINTHRLFCWFTRPEVH